MKTRKVRARTLLCVILALVIALGSVSVVSAEVLMVDLGNTRLSDTVGETSTYAEFTYIPDFCTAKVILQEKYNNSWRNATDLSTIAIQKVVSHDFSIYLVHDFQLIKGKIYRTKVILTETKGSNTTTETYYGPIF